MEICSHGLAKAFTMALTPLLFSPPVRAQSARIFSLTPELVTKVAQNSQDSNLKAYHAKFTEIEYHPLVQGEVASPQYEAWQQNLKQYEAGYLEYRQMFVKDSTERADVSLILKNIDSYLSSNEKSEVKDKYLIEAQSLANKHQVQIKGEDKGLISTILTQPNQHKPTKIYVLHNGKKSSSKKDLEYYKTQIQTIRFQTVRVPYNAQKYLELMEKGKSIPKMVKGQVPSNEIQTRKTFVVDREAQVSEFSGDFQELPQPYILAIKDVKTLFVKNELSNEYRGHSNTGELTEPYPLLKKSGTDDYYFITSESFYTSLANDLRGTEILQMIHRLGYKEYQEQGDYYIKSKTAEIKLDAGTYFALKQNPNYIAQYDSDQVKISALIKQTISHSTTLDKYISQYRIQRSKMPTANLNAWRSATTSAQKIMNQINKLSEKYDGNYSFNLSNKLNE